ncbi:DUF6069 family protein [Actinoallomurus liliacearum]|uniref:DUF6069 family protein n=1 Tax=Actinoallomurus liliacearum TaxID=1080073 RepID=UPI003CD09163
MTTTAIAAVSSSAGVPLKVDGKAIPPVGFAQMTLMCAVIGIVLAVARVSGAWGGAARRRTRSERIRASTRTGRSFSR